MAFEPLDLVSQSLGMAVRIALGQPVALCSRCHRPVVVYHAEVRGLEPISFCVHCSVVFRGVSGR